MKIAILTDVHGNLPALEAALSDTPSRSMSYIPLNIDMIDMLDTPVA